MMPESQGPTNLAERVREHRDAAPAPPRNHRSAEPFVVAATLLDAPARVLCLEFG